MATFHPDLAVARFIPKFSFTKRMLPMLRSTPRTAPAPPDVRITDRTVTGRGPGGAGDEHTVSVRIYDPVGRDEASAALLWSHGGGFLFGSPEQDEASSIGFARELGALVVAVRYRFSPEHPAPAALDDAYAALTWLFDEAPELGIDASRIAIGGASAGGGLTAGLALMAHDRGDVRPAFQLLVYPMLDDRTVLRTDMSTKGMRGWTPKSNRLGWSSYLAGAPGAADASPYAVPARRADLTGLPPAWIGVGTLDLFHDEDVEYARRLRDAGVPCELSVIAGAFHGFDAILPKAEVSREFWRTQRDALRAPLEN